MSQKPTTTDYAAAISLLGVSRKSGQTEEKPIPPPKERKLSAKSIARQLARDEAKLLRLVEKRRKPAENHCHYEFKRRELIDLIERNRAKLSTFADGKQLLEEQHALIKNRKEAARQKARQRAKAEKKHKQDQKDELLEGAQKVTPNTMGTTATPLSVQPPPPQAAFNPMMQQQQMMAPYMMAPLYIMPMWPQQQQHPMQQAMQQWTPPTGPPMASVAAAAETPARTQCNVKNDEDDE